MVQFNARRPVERPAGSGKVVTGGLAGAAALAAGSQAYAAIIVVAPPANLPNVAAPGTAGPINWDVNGDATNDLAFTFRYPNSTTQVHWQANVFGVTGHSGVVGYTGPFVQYATRLAAGAPISGASTFRGDVGSTQVVLGSLYGSGAGIYYGGFATPTPGRGFMGFKFKIGGQDRFGWLDVEVDAPTGGQAGTGGILFHGAAYENSGAPINAGDVPEPGSLALLALGAAGVLATRRR